MAEHEVIGYAVMALVVLVGLFAALHRPINENTKAMTTLTVKVEQLTERFDGQINDFEGYKKHVSTSQQRQWDIINEHSNMLLEHDMEIKRLKGDKS